MFIYYLYRIIDILFWAYTALIGVRAILSWLPTFGGSTFRHFIYIVTEPVLGIFRRILPPSPRMPIDFSPILAIFALQILQRIINRILLWLM